MARGPYCRPSRGLEPLKVCHCLRMENHKVDSKGPKLSEDEVKSIGSFIPSEEVDAILQELASVIKKSREEVFILAKCALINQSSFINSKEGRNAYIRRGYELCGQDVAGAGDDFQKTMEFLQANTEVFAIAALEVQLDHEGKYELPL